MSIFANRSTKWLKTCIHYFKTLDVQQKAIFACYLEKNYAKQLDPYEKKIRNTRLKLLTAMKKIRALSSTDSRGKLERLENLYEIIFSLNTLKLRISDQAIFEICEVELKKISLSLSDALKHAMIFLNSKQLEKKSARMMDDTAKNIGRLSRQIDALEELYRSTLQVVSQEPIFFLFFVQDLIAFRDALESFFLEMLND